MPVNFGIKTASLIEACKRLKTVSKEGASNYAEIAMLEHRDGAIVLSARNFDLGIEFDVSSCEDAFEPAFFNIKDAAAIAAAAKKAKQDCVKLTVSALDEAQREVVLSALPGVDAKYVSDNDHEVYSYMFAMKPDSAVFELPADFTQVMKEANPFASRDEARKNISGVHFSKSGDMLVITATNGHALYTRRLSGMDDVVFEYADRSRGDAIVPIALCDLYDRMSLNGAVTLMRTGSCEGFDSKKAVSFTQSCDDYTVTVSGRLVDGLYPDFTQVIPNGGVDGGRRHSAFFCTARFDMALDLFKVIGSGQQQFPVRFNCSPARIDMSGVNGSRKIEVELLIEDGTLADLMPEEYDKLLGKDANFGAFQANVKYLEIARNVFKDAEELSLEFGTSLEPLVFWSLERDVACVVMPIRLQQ